MLNFPQYSIIFYLSLGFILVGSLGTIYSVYFWFYEDKSNVDSDDTFKMIMAVIICPIFLLLGLFISTNSFYQTYQFRSINPSDVATFTIVTTESEFKPDGKIEVMMDDKVAIQNILMSLNKCEEFSPNHETFRDGYKINFKFSKDTYRDDFYISVYRKSTAENGRTSVNAHLGKDNNLNLGNYDCPELQGLVEKHINPLFSE